MTYPPKSFFVLLQLGFGTLANSNRQIFAPYCLLLYLKSRHAYSFQWPASSALASISAVLPVTSSLALSISLAIFILRAVTLIFS